MIRTKMDASISLYLAVMESWMDSLLSQFLFGLGEVYWNGSMPVCINYGFPYPHISLSVPASEMHLHFLHGPACIHALFASLDA